MVSVLVLSHSVKKVDVVSKKRCGGEVQTQTLWNVYKYVRYNTANNVSNCGGDPVTQLIVYVYQMIKL